MAFLWVQLCSSYPADVHVYIRMFPPIFAPMWPIHRPNTLASCWSPAASLDFEICCARRRSHSSPCRVWKPDELFDGKKGQQLNYKSRAGHK